MCQARLGTVIVETAIVLCHEWDIVREGVISQKSRRIELFDKCWNTCKPGGGDFCGLQEFLLSKRTMCQRESWRGVSYGILLQNYEQNYGRFARNL